ncbi:hypothetical protein ACFPN0_01155 [Kitasatospora cinereorecta]
MADHLAHVHQEQMLRVTCAPHRWVHQLDLEIGEHAPVPGALAVPAQSVTSPAAVMSGGR